MCGIAGFLYPPASIDSPEEVLQAMTGALDHRGPDAGNTVVDEPVFLGHRRLEVIDPSGGGQPFVTEKVVLVYNGEIYNYRELRSELTGLGYRFVTESDTEVLARAWEEFGVDCLHRLNGMFAFAVWDREARILTLARDRMGQKPLYYSLHNGGVAFASELHGMMQWPEVSGEPDLAGLRQYLCFDVVPTPSSHLAGVHRLEPGTALQFQKGKCEKKTYWRLEDAEEHASDLTLEALLVDAVQLRLRSDVPLGIFLSGGIDSSLIAALAAQSLPAHQLHTFSIGFEDATFDESAHARNVARHLGTRHHERILETSTLLDVLPTALESLDEPIADGSYIPTFLLSQFARETVTVALGGDGGDELFCGYPTFRAHGIANRLNWIPRFMWASVVSPLLEKIPVSHSNISLDFQLKRFALGMQTDPYLRHYVWIGSLAPWLHGKIFRDEVLSEAPEIRLPERVLAGFEPGSSWSEMQRLTALYTRLYLADDILVKVDRASMAHSLEVRAPFLDPRVVSRAFLLPDRAKIQGKSSKIALRQLATRHLPATIVSRPKKGFGMPIGQWLKGPLEDWARSMLSPELLTQTGVFKPALGQELMDAHRAGRADHRKILWALLVWMTWWQRLRSLRR